MGATRREELLIELERCAKLANGDDGRRDPEVAHSDADDALLAYINDPGITAAYEAISPRWYA